MEGFAIEKDVAVSSPRDEGGPRLRSRLREAPLLALVGNCSVPGSQHQHPLSATVRSKKERREQHNSES